MGLPLLPSGDGEITHGHRQNEGFAGRRPLVELIAELDEEGDRPALS